MLVKMKTCIYTHNGVEREFNIKMSLRASEKVQFVSTVVDTIVDNNYLSFLRDLIFDFEIIRMFTDVDVRDIANSKNAINNIEDFLAETNIVDIVKSHISDGVIEELNKAVNDNIQYRTGVRLNNIEDVLSDFTRSIKETFSGLDAAKLMEMVERASKTIETTKVQKAMTEYFKTDEYRKHLNERLEQYNKK